ncbi:MAG: MbnP family protein [Bacteroidia bacterium]
MRKWWIFALVPLLFSACKNEDESPEPEQNKVTFGVTFEHDGAALQFDTLMFQHAAGYTMSVSRLQFYLSNIQLIRSDSSLVSISDYHFIDAKDAATQTFSYTLPATGHFIGLKMQIGLDSAHNITDALPALMENLNMAWPEVMGGGYHFLKLEGEFTDSTGNYGYAMHMGTNNYLVQCVVPAQFDLSAGNNTIHLSMNVNEWFKNPSVYDFNIDGNYSMGVMAAMMKLKANGTDVFTKQ